MPGGFVPVSVRALAVDSVLPFDLYLRHGFTGDHTLYRPGNRPFTEEILEGALAHRLTGLYVPGEQSCELFRYCRRVVSEVVADGTIPIPRKAEIIYRSATTILEDLFTNPEAEGRILQAKGVVRDTVTHMLSGPAAARSMVFVASRDYFTYTHSMNVAIYAIALAQRIYGDRGGHDLRRMGEGFVLHDIGMAWTPAEIIHKPAPLSPAEWDRMRRHPEDGIRILEKTGELDEVIAPIVLEHHERHDGSGYPRGLKESEIHPYARICAVADIFDAITTFRSYRSPLGTFDALKQIRDRMGHIVDPHCLREFVRIFAL